MKIEKKVNRVIASCKTRSQILVAARFVVNAVRSGKITITEASYWQGVIDGIAHTKGWE